MQNDIRWKQRFYNYHKALIQLAKFIEIYPTFDGFSLLSSQDLRLFLYYHNQPIKSQKKSEIWNS